MGLFNNLFGKKGMQVKFNKDMECYAVKLHTSILFVGTKEMCETFVENYGRMH